MSITKEELQHLAHLVRMEIEEKELDVLERNISMIIDYGEELQHVDTTGVTPTYTVSKRTNVLRDDVVEHHENTQHLIENTPESHDGYVVVPPLFGG